MALILYEDTLRLKTNQTDFIVVSGLPKVGKTTLINGIKKDFTVIQLPNELNSIEELRKYKDLIHDLKMKEKKIIVEGRNYVIELLLGKVSLAETPNLENPDTVLRGNALTYDLAHLRPLEYTDKKTIVKILEYSLVSLPSYSTYIPKLVDEAISLHNKNALDEALQAVMRVKKLYQKFPINKDVKGNEAIIYPLLSLFSSKEELKYAWGLLSDTWKELIFYRIDSALHLLPGTAKKVINQFISEIKNESKFQNPINLLLDLSPLYLKGVEELVTGIINGKNGLILGGVKSNKTSIAKQVADYISTYYSYNIVYYEDKGEQQFPPNTLLIIDYHKEGNNYLSLRKILKAKDLQVPKLFVLTDELTHIIKPKKVKIFIATVIEQDVMNFINYIKDLDKDYSDYVYNVIFEGDPNVLKWYAPLIKMVVKYGDRLPIKFSKAVLEANGRSKVEENDPILQWFSYTKMLNEKAGEYLLKDEVNTDFKDPITDYENEILNILKEKKSPHDFLSILIDTYRETYTILPEENELEDYFGVDKKTTKLGKKIIKDLLPRLKEVFDSPACVSSVDDYYKFIYEEKTKDIDQIVRFASLWLLDNKIIYENMIETLIKPKDIECLRSAFKAILIDLKMEDKKLFFLLRPLIIERIKENMDDELISYYLSMCLITNTKKYVSEIVKNEKWKIFKYVFFPEENVDVKDPLAFFANTLGFIFTLAKVFKEDDIEAAIENTDKFEKQIMRLKSIMNKMDKDKVKFISRIVLGEEDPMPTLEYLLDKFKFKSSFIYYYNYNFSLDLKDFINTIEMLMMPYYNYILRGNEPLDFDQVKDIFSFYRVKLAKSLLYGGKYEYKTVLNDIIELADEFGDYIDELNVAKIIAEIALGKKSETYNYTFHTTVAYLLRDDNFEAIEKMYKRLKFVEDYHISSGEVNLDEVYLLKIIVEYYVNKKSVNEIIKEIGDESVNIGIPVSISVVNYKPKLIASIILFID